MTMLERRPLVKCCRCIGGTIQPDLAGELSCINCGAPPPGTTPPRVAGPAEKGTNHARPDRAVDHAWHPGER